MLFIKLKQMVEIGWKFYRYLNYSTSSRYIAPQSKKIKKPKMPSVITILSVKKKRNLINVGIYLYDTKGGFFICGYIIPPTMFVTL